MTAGTTGGGTMGKDTTRLLGRVAAGDPVAFEKLYRLTAGMVHALTRRMLPDDSASADVTEQVYLRVWAEAHTYERSLGTAETWLLGLAHRCAVERIRADRPLPPKALSDAPLRRAPLGTAAQHAISLLTPEQSEALELAYLGGRTHAESARVLGVDQATFRVRVGTALSRVRQGMEAPVPSSALAAKG